MGHAWLNCKVLVNTMPTKEDAREVRSGEHRVCVRVHVCVYTYVCTCVYAFLCVYVSMCLHPEHEAAVPISNGNPSTSHACYVV